MQRKYRFKGILTDLDDTLCNTDETFRKFRRNAAYKVLSQPLKLKSYKEFEKLFLQAKMEIKIELAGTASSHNRILYFKRISEFVNKGLNPEILRKAYREYWKATYQNLELFPKVRETLGIIKKEGLKIVIISDMTTEIQLEKIHYLNISKYIDVLITSEEVGTEKPNSSLFLNALHRLNILAKDAIAIGDSPTKDIEGAKALGLEAVQIVTRKDRKIMKSGHFKPDHVIYNFNEILKIL